MRNKDSHIVCGVGAKEMSIVKVVNSTCDSHTLFLFSFYCSCRWCPIRVCAFKLEFLTGLRKISESKQIHKQNNRAQHTHTRTHKLISNRRAIIAGSVCEEDTLTHNVYKQSLSKTNKLLIGKDSKTRPSCGVYCCRFVGAIQHLFYLFIFLVFTKVSQCFLNVQLCVWGRKLNQR